MAVSRFVRTWWFWVVTILVILIGVFVISPLPPTEITFVTGSQQGAYFAIAESEYKPSLDSAGVEMIIRPSNGSVEGLSLLQAGEVDAGFIQGGIAQDIAVEGVSALGSVFYEPIWVFHRSDLDLERLADARDLRVAIGPDGSGIQPVARLLLELNGITDESATLLAIPSGEAREQLQAGEIDAAVFIVSPQAAWINELIRQPEIDLLSFERSPAYVSRFPFLSALDLSEGSFDLVDNIPERDITLLAVTAQLAVRDDLHPSLMRLLLRQASAVHSQPQILQEFGFFPTASFIELPLHPEAFQYYQDGVTWFEQNFPFLLAAFLNRLVFFAVPLVSVIAIGRSVLPAMTMAVRFRTSQWYRELEEIDKSMDKMSLAEIEAQIDHLADLERTITDEGRMPFMGFGTFYTVKLHMGYVLERLEGRRDALLEEHTSS